MSKRGSDSTRAHATQVKKRRGVGFHTIPVPDSDEEDPPPTSNDELALMTKIRVGPSGQAGTISVGSIPIPEEQESSFPIPLEDTAENSVDPIDNVVHTVPAKPQKTQKKVNDSVSDPSTLSPLYR